MKITKEWLEQNNACEEGIEWFTKQKENNAIILIEKLLFENHFGWANWSICRILKRDDKTRYAIHAAKLVLHIFEDKHPDDKRPRKAIEAANNYLNSTSVFVNGSTSICADSCDIGNGGKVIIWADETTEFYANMSWLLYFIFVR